MASNAKGTRESTRNVLDFVKQTKLNEWIKNFYTQLGKDDAESAEMAAIELGFPVSAGNVKYLREVNTIPNNRARTIKVVSDDYKEMEARVAAVEAKLLNPYVLDETFAKLESRIEKLEKQFDVFKLAARHNVK